MQDFILGMLALAVGLNLLYGTASRGKSLVKVELLGIETPIRAVQIAISLSIASGGIYMMLR